MEAEFLDLMNGEPHEIFCSENAYLRSDEPDETHPGSGVLAIGNENYIYPLGLRSMMRFPRIIIDTNSILAIYLWLEARGKQNDSNLESIKMQFYETDGNWDENTATWNNTAQYRTTPKYTATIPFADIIDGERIRIDIPIDLIPYLFGNGMLLTANEEDLPDMESFTWSALACGHQYCQPAIIIRTK